MLSLPEESLKYKYARNFMCCVDCNMPFAIIILQSHVVYIYIYMYIYNIYIYIYMVPPKKKPTFLHFLLVCTVFLAYLGTFFFWHFLNDFEVVFTNVYKRYGSIAADLDPRSKILGKTSWIQGLDPRSKIQDSRKTSWIQGLDPRSKILGKTSWIQGLDPRSKIQDSRKNFLDPRSGSKIQDSRKNFLDPQTKLSQIRG